MELQPGVKVPIPCRNCLQSMIPFEVSEGTREVSCPRCSLVTIVEVYRQEGQLRVRTSPCASKERSKATGRQNQSS